MSDRVCCHCGEPHGKGNNLMTSRDWTPREKAIKKAAILVMRHWGVNESLPRIVREEVWCEARDLARRIFDMADAVNGEGNDRDEV